MNKIFSFRLQPGQDLKSEIQNFCTQNNILAGCLLSAVGSLDAANLRLASSPQIFNSVEKFEIVSATGTISKNGCHIHISIADTNGHVKGGHLLDQNKIFTTCEIVILALDDREFKREIDSTTGFNELKIYFINS